MEQTVSISNEVSREKGIPGSTLKIIAIITMFIDHIGAVVLEGKLSDLGMAQAMQTQEGLQEFMAQYGVLYLMDMIMRLIGRMGFPIFCFLLIEGFPIIHLTIHMNGQMRNYHQRTACIYENGLRMIRIIRLQNNLSCKRKRPVYPGASDHTAIYFYIEFAIVSCGRFRIRFDPETGRICMSGSQVKTAS